jgi:excisionase family DNA binding protein
VAGHLRRMNETDETPDELVRINGVSPSAQPARLLLTPEEAAAVLSVGRTKVYELIARGQLFSVRIGASRRIPRVALETFVSRLVQEGAFDGGRREGRSCL